MPRRFVDLSITLDNDTIADPDFMRPKISYMNHYETLPGEGQPFHGIPPEAYPGGDGYAAAEWVTLNTHNGTHLDAPYHFHPTMDGGQRAITIDEVDLSGTEPTLIIGTMRVPLSQATQISGQ